MPWDNELISFFVGALLLVGIPVLLIRYAFKQPLARYGLGLPPRHRWRLGLMRQGCTMGISSRGVGTLKKKCEQNEVQDDFELICFDLVSSPSTPGAYLYLNKDDRPKYEEKLTEHENLHSSSSSLNKSIDLMKRLSDYLGK